MSTPVGDRVDSWSERPFSDGYTQLHELSESDFSGVIRAGGAELYMTRGVAIAVQHGNIDDFEDATGSLYESPSDALPLLAVMQERSDEVRAKYYTEKTSIEEVDATLSDGGFTGYVELSENVLSGDYYLVYHAGKSMSVAYVGEAERFIEGEEAFEMANDEVGIYEVRPVDIEQVELPDPPEPEPSPDESTSAAGSDTREDAAESRDEPTETSPSEEEETPAPNQEQTLEGESEQDTGASETQPGTHSGSSVATQNPQTPGHGVQSEQSSDSKPEQSPRAAKSRETATDRTHHPEETQTPPRPATQQQQQDEVDTTTSPAERTAPGESSSEQSGGATAVPDLETRAIPSLDPDRTELPDQNDGEAEETDEAPRRNNDQQAATGKPRPQENPAPQSPAVAPQQDQAQGQHETSRDENEPTTQAQENDTTEIPEPEEIAELEEQLKTQEAEIEALEDELETTREERDDLQAQLEEVREQRDELQTEIDRLEDELHHLETELGAATDAERRITAGEALAGTDLFIRYHSKGDATLEKAHGGSVLKSDVHDNLRLEKHTQFEAANVSVGGQVYDEFLEDTTAYQFVQWVVKELLFEIRDTDHTKELRNLYDALPKVDRAELSGVVDVTYVEDGQETRTQESFDVVLRDRMGHPLLVANLNDSLEAATESMMENLITAAERVGQSSDGFACAFLVTTSFFEPGALETASQATQGGLLSRDKRKSFVNLSRKNGYHLCLVEARKENFHLAVPEL